MAFHAISDAIHGMPFFSHHFADQLIDTWIVPGHVHAHAGIPSLKRRGYHIVPQWMLGTSKVKFVVISGSHSSRSIPPDTY